MAYSRNPTTGGGASNPPNSNVNTTTTTGPRTDTTTSSSSQMGGGSGSSSFSESLRGSSSGVTTDRTVRDRTTKNMDDESYAILMNLLRQSAAGGSPADKEKREQIRGEIIENQTQRARYSKDAAMYDSAEAAAAQMHQALQQMIPAITAGIDSAGTSGSAMAALLHQQAAEGTARNAAMLQLDAAISYGQIANQNSGIIAELLKIDDPVTKTLLESLNIAKGAIVSEREVTDRVVKENKSWNESKSGSSQQQQSSWQTNTGTQTTNVGAQTNTSNVESIYTPNKGSSIQQTAGQAYVTPSSYRTPTTATTKGQTNRGSAGNYYF